MPAPPLDALPPLAVQLVQQAARFATYSYPVGWAGLLAPCRAVSPGGGMPCCAAPWRAVLGMAGRADISAKPGVLAHLADCHPVDGPPAPGRRARLARKWEHWEHSHAPHPPYAPQPAPAALHPVGASPPPPGNSAALPHLTMQEVREAAVGLLERALKRYTCLAPLVLPPVLAALAKLPPGSTVGGRERACPAVGPHRGASDRQLPTAPQAAPCHSSVLSLSIPLSPTCRACILSVCMTCRAPGALPPPTCCPRCSRRWRGRARRPPQPATSQARPPTACTLPCTSGAA